MIECGPDDMQWRAVVLSRLQVADGRWQVAVVVARDEYFLS